MWRGKRNEGNLRGREYEKYFVIHAKKNIYTAGDFLPGCTAGDKMPNLSWLYVLI